MQSFRKFFSSRRGLLSSRRGLLSSRRGLLSSRRGLLSSRRELKNLRLAPLFYNPGITPLYRVFFYYLRPVQSLSQQFPSRKTKEKRVNPFDIVKKVSYLTPV